MIRFYLKEPKAEEIGNRKGDLVIIDVYGHTQISTKNHPEVAEQLFQNLKDVYIRERAGTDLIFIMADYNSKIGRKLDGDGYFMGEHGRG